jgi:hypothetical protein
MHRIASRATILLLAASVGYAIRGCPLIDPPTTLTSLSPDDKFRVIILERRLGLLDIDRNFHVRLEDVKTGRGKVIFRSPDEGRPVGSERIIWSLDSSRFVLLGRHFSVADLRDVIWSGWTPDHGPNTSDRPGF